MPNSPVSSAPTIVAVPALWNPRADAMELHAVPKPLECPPAKDPYPDISTFQKVADAKIDIWRVNAYDKQTVDHLAGDRSRSSRLAPVYEIDFDKPKYNSEEATVTFPIKRQDLLPLVSFYA